MSDLKTETTHPPSPAVIQHCDYKYKALRQSRLKKKKQSSCANWGRERRRWTAESRGEKGSFSASWGQWRGDGPTGEHSKQFCSNWTKRNSSSSSFFLSNFILFYVANAWKCQLLLWQFSKDWFCFPLEFECSSSESIKDLLRFELWKVFQENKKKIIIYL